MECMLLPKEPTAPAMKVPHIDEVRYSGKDWFSYPHQRVIEWPKIGGTYHYELRKYMGTLKNSRQIEPLLQTWLFFGLLSEFFRGIAPETTDEVVNWVYQKYTRKDADRTYLTTSTLLKDMEGAVLRDLTDKVLFRESCLRAKDRLYMAWVVFTALPADFDSRISASIGAVAEILSHSVNLAFRLYKLPLNCPTSWASTYLKKESPRYDGVPSVRKTMLSNGWCPSDISRSANNFTSLQMLHLLGNMSRSLPPRDHSKCDDIHCIAYQIGNSYEVRHVNEKCECRLVHVDNSMIIRILEEGDSIPLLRFVGDMDNLEIEIVPSEKETPYVAISHVWADGLGNQKANALNSCELIRLRTLIEALGSQDASMKDPNSKHPDKKSSYVWIDTLCCPVGPVEAKKLSLKKLQNVYKDAAQVLVLDAGIEAYKAGDIDLIEQMARISTCGWLRRLWTLQEGALAESLYFQFADIAVSLDLQKIKVAQLTPDIRNRIIMFDFLSEYQQFQSFYHFDRVNKDENALKPPDLFLVNSALQYRSLSIVTDEPLCIACLLSIPTAALLGDHVPEGDRMKLLWGLIAEKYKGVPASIIFFEDIHIDEPGWRWAPSSLLTAKPQFHRFNTRILLWADKNLGRPTPNGLRVKLPGYRFVLGNSKDKQPWSGVTKISETNVFFRDVESSKWYLVFDTEFWALSRSWTEEQQREYNDQNKSPLNDLISQVPSVIIRDTSGNLGILASIVPPAERAATATATATNASLDGIPIRTHFHIVCTEASPAQNTFMNALESLAHELRQSELTARLQALHQNDTPEALSERAVALQALKDEMKKMMKKAIAQRPDLGLAIDSIWGEKWRDLVWVGIGDWYYNDFKAAPVRDDQVWYVD